MTFIMGSVLLFAATLVLFGRLGQEFIPTLDEKNIAMQALRIPSTALSQSQEMQLRVETAVSAFPEVAYVFSEPGRKESRQFQQVAPDIFGLETSELASLGAKRFHGKPPLIDLGVHRRGGGGRVQAFAIIRRLFGRALRHVLMLTDRAHLVGAEVA